MDFNHFTLQWLATFALYWAFTRGQHIGSCYIDPAATGDGELFEVRTIEVEEGILMDDRKLIVTIPLTGNSSNGYIFDEPYFKRPYNVKTKARPAHFDIVFINISNTGNTTTTHPPRHPSLTTQTARFLASTPQNSNSDISGDNLYGASGYPLLYAISSPNSTDTGWNSLGVTSSPVTSSTTNIMPSTNGTAIVFPSVMEPEKCGGAQIFQIYDLDREEKDEHYLSISNYAEDWGIPTIIRIKVTDINDNSPVFVPDSLYTQITSDVGLGDIVAHVQATDADIGINAYLRYSIEYTTERRGNETHSPGSPTFLIHETLGLVTLFEDISDLVPPTKITFNVIVKDKGDSYIANRATATVTISIVEKSWASVIQPDDTSKNDVSGGVIAGSVLGALFVCAVIFYGVYRWKRNATDRRDAQLQFMMDDDNLITA